MKRFTYSFLVLLMALLALPASVLARETVTFDFAANPWGLPVSTNNADETDKGVITAPIVQDGVTLTTTDATNNKCKLWNTSGSITLRIYKNGGSATFTAPAGKVIEKIELSGSNLNFTANVGTYSSPTWTQPAEQVNAVTLSATATTKTIQIRTAVLTIADPGEAADAPKPLPQAANIAAFKALDVNTEAVLTLDNVKVLYVNGKDMIVRDATGAIDFYNLGINATAGKLLNGKLTVKYTTYLGLQEAVSTSNTNISTISIDGGDIMGATTMTLAEASEAANQLKYAKLTDFTVEEDGNNTYLVSGDYKIQIYDKFKVGYTLPEVLESVSGILICYQKNSSTDPVIQIAPTSSDDIVGHAAPQPKLNEDVTATYIKNPGFEECEATTASIGTAKNGQGIDYEAAGWKLAATGEYSNSAVFAYGSSAQLNDVLPPAADNEGNEGKALGITTGWKGQILYQSAAEVTLPAGYYTLKVAAYNAAGDATQLTSLFGFTTADNTYASTKKSFPSKEWTSDEVSFVLESEATGHITIGGKPVSGGSIANGRVFFDNLTLTFSDLLPGSVYALEQEITAATEVANSGVAPKADLQAAIATAEAAKAETDYKNVLAATEALKAAVAAYNDANTHFVAYYATKDLVTKKTETLTYAKADKAEALTKTLATAPTTVAEADSLANALTLQARTVIESNAMAEGLSYAVDYTSRIKNANSEALEGWTLANAEGFEGSIDIKSNEPFTDAAGNATHSYFDGGKWEKNAWDLTWSQNLTLPKGKYLLTATSRASAGMTTFDLYAGEKTAAMPFVGAAGEIFNRGWNDTSLEFDVDADDTEVAIGVHGATATIHNWMSFTRFRLVKIDEPADPVADAKKLYEETLETAKATVADEAYAVVTGEELATLNAVIAAEITEQTKAAYDSITNLLIESTKAFTDAKPAYQNLVDTKAQYKDFDFSAYPYADSGRASAVKRSMSATAKTATDAAQIAQNIVNGIRGYVESNAVAEGVETAENATEMIQNANAEALEGWTTTNAEGSNGSITILKNEPLTDSEGNTEYPYFDGANWNSAWDVTYTQTVGLPRGKYLLSVFSRASEGVSTFDLIANVVADENGGIAPLEGFDPIEGDGDNTGDVVAADTAKFATPMQHIGAEDGIFGRGWNNNTLEFEVTSDYANVDLGIHGATATQHNWMSFTSFQLTLLEQSVEEVEVENIAALRNIVTDPYADYNVKLKLTDAKISKIVKESYGGQEMTSFAVIEDATGALSLGYLLPEAEATGLISTEGWKDGTTLNGYICGTYNYPSDMFVNANTGKSEITATESTFTPTAANLSDVLKAENNYRTYEFKDVKVATVGEDDFVSYALVANDTTNVSMIDAFSVLPEEMPTEFATISGILVGDIEYGSESADFNFYPTAYTLKPTGISSIEQAAKNAAVYTVNGVKVRAAGESVKGLKKGVYVVGGKKIVVK